MPMFTLPSLPTAFLKDAIAPELYERIGDASAFRLRVLYSEKRAFSLIVFVQIKGRAKKLIEPDWRSTLVEKTLARKLKLPVLNRLYVYDSADHHFLPMDIRGWAESSEFFDSTGIVGWHSLDRFFRVVGLTPTTQNLVLEAKDYALCRSLTLSAGELPLAD